MQRSSGACGEVTDKRAGATNSWRGRVPAKANPYLRMLIMQKGFVVVMYRKSVF